MCGDESGVSRASTGKAEVQPDLGTAKGLSQAVTLSLSLSVSPILSLPVSVIPSQQPPLCGRKHGHQNILFS